jgi:hydrogenase expression/formation protein
MSEESQAPERRIVVLGVGNLLWADEGFGVRCVEALGEGFDLPADVALMDGGTLGLALVPELLEATHVLLFDAVAHRGEPGALIVVRDDDIPALMGGNKMSLHQVGMNDILASLELLNHKPAHFTADPGRAAARHRGIAPLGRRGARARRSAGARCRDRCAAAVAVRGWPAPA